jgi:hypothetical protein
MEGTQDSKFLKSEYEVHQFGQNFSFLAFKGEAVGLTQISSYNVRGRRIFFRSNHVFLAIKSPKT